MTSRWPLDDLEHAPLGASADGGALAEAHVINHRKSVSIAHRRAVEAVRLAREAWLFTSIMHGSSRAKEVCALLSRCAEELGDDSPVTALPHSLDARPEVALRAWLAVDAWRRAKAAV